MDLSRSLEDQGPFDLIIHKTSDIVVKADFGSVQSQNELRILTVSVVPIRAFSRKDELELAKRLSELQLSVLS